MSISRLSVEIAREKTTAPRQAYPVNGETERCSGSCKLGNQGILASGPGALYRESLQRKTPSRTVCHRLCSEGEGQPVRGNCVV